MFLGSPFHEVIDDRLMLYRSFDLLCMLQKKITGFFFCFIFSLGKAVVVALHLLTYTYTTCVACPVQYMGTFDAEVIGREM